MTVTPQDINPDIPDTFSEYRPWQYKGVQDVIDALKSGAKVVFVKAPTGSGKTLLAESVRSLYKGNTTSSPYICTTKTLQDQILKDFPYAKVLKGRDNYPTRRYPELWPGRSCGDCDPRNTLINPDDIPEWLEEDYEQYGNRIISYNKRGEPYVRHCDNCGPQALCPYVVARDDAVWAPLCVTNTAYYLREVNGPGRLHERDLIIVDEADSFTDTILDTFSVNVPKWVLDWPGCPLPETQSNEEHIDQWITEMIRFTKALENRITGSERDLYKEKWGPKRLRGRETTLLSLQANLSIANTEDWVYIGPSSRSRKRYTKIELKPIVAGDWIDEFVWDHADQWVLMSASFVSVELEAKRLQLRPSQVAQVEVDYTFDPKRRPIVYWPSAFPYSRASEKEHDVIGDMAKKIGQISAWYPDERILVHTFSHKRTNQLAERIEVDRPVFDYDSPGSRDDTIERYRNTPGAILFAAGLDRGYDFKYDACRVCIIVKTPFADLSDPVVSERKRRGLEGRAWYDLTTTRALVQMVGRGMRAEDDWLVTYLLDKSCEDYVRGYKKKLLPPEFHTAVKFGQPIGREYIADLRDI